MESKSAKRTKTWLYHFRYLKIFHKDNRHETSEMPINPESQNRGNDESTHFKSNLRKWHRRMKNCFSKNSRIRKLSIETENESQMPSKDAVQEASECMIQGSNIEPRLCVPQEIQSSPVCSIETQNSPKINLTSLSHQLWYWGPVSKALVEAKLEGAPDGAFLVRDSSSDRHIFTISFRSVGKTFHTRIEHTSSGYRFFNHKAQSSVKDLIEEAMRISSDEGLFCYTKSEGIDPNYPVRLLKPLSRYDDVRSLQSLSRFVIRQHINVNEIDKLSLPFSLLSFLKEENYFS
ncbi:hypothetical protein ABEB36_001457 [Hypothenemus hampei]|uniref:Suppressor of cytokine signaling 6 n=1 Tax=Hypothenemus hampei TaxID=57062 RepID=A0ABD1FEL9_HYPHA